MILRLYGDGTFRATDLAMVLPEADRIHVCDFSEYGYFAADSIYYNMKERQCSAYQLRDVLAEIDPETQVEWLGSGCTANHKYGGDFSSAEITPGWRGGQATVADILREL